jgi:cytochrome P450
MQMERTCPTATLPVQPAVYQRYERLRDEGPIVWDPALNGWTVTSFELCEFVERDDDLFSRADRRKLVDDATYDLITKMHGGSRSLLLVEGAPHDELHGALSLALTRQVRAKRGIIDNLAREYAKRLDGHVDFSAVYSERFPTAAITAVLGMPWVNDEEQLRVARECTAALGAAATTLDFEGDDFRGGIDASAVLSGMLRPSVAEQLDRDDGNIVNAIYRAGREIYPDWGLDDVVVHCRLLYFAGSNSSSHFLSNIVYVLATNPAVWEYLRDHRDEIPVFIEEVLRVVPPVQTRPRVATRDVMVGDQLVRRGDVLFLNNGAANRDPDRYEYPATIDIGYGARRHLAFNAGPRACPGTPTARMEGRSVINALLDRFATIALDSTQPDPVFVGTMNSGYLPMHVICEPVESPGVQSLA